MSHHSSSFQRCRVCGKQTKPGFLFCPQCGTELPLDASVPLSSSMQRHALRISNKTIGLIALAMLGFSILLSVITSTNQQVFRQSATSDDLPAALVEPTQTPTIEIIQPRPVQKLKVPQSKPAPQASKEESAQSGSERITTYSQPAAKPSGYITGPHGGCYYINRNGKKTYVDRSLCGSSYSYGSSSFSRSGYITGPRGGCYYINGNGNKTYVDRSLCR